MWSGITTLANNVGLSFETIIIFLVFLAGLLFYAKDFKIGVIGHFIAYALVFLWFYNYDLSYNLPLVFMGIFLIILSLTIYTSKKTADRGAII